MHIPRTIQLLQSLTAGELRRFVQYVASPYFNQRQSLVRLATYLQRAAPDYPPVLLERRELFRCMFGDEVPFDEQQVHDQLSGLLGLLEHFLAQIDFEEDAYAYDRHVLQALDKRNLHEHFPRVLRKTQRRLQQEPQQDFRYYLNRYQVEVVEDSFYGKQQNRRIGHDMREMVRSLDLFYISSKLRSACEMLNRQTILNQDYRPQLVEEILGFLDQTDNPYRQVPAIAIYYQILLTYRHENQPEHYEVLTQLLEQHARAFSRSEAYSMYAYAQNYCIRRINGGESAYLQQLFLLYQRLLADELIIEGGQLAHEHYKNISTVGLRLRQYDWVLQFLETYKSRLNSTDRESAYTYNLAVFHYEQQQYREAMRLLQQVEFADVYYRLSSKALLMKIYYEMADDEALDYLVKAFSVFLRRNKDIAAYQAQTYTKMLRLTRKMARLRTRRAHTPDDKYAEVWQGLDREMTQGVPNVNWLRSKLADLAPADQLKNTA
ncbi:MAG: hypothetical protein OHK0039_26520 [Bacteroidia bacterium]